MTNQVFNQQTTHPKSSRLRLGSLLIVLAVLAWGLWQHQAVIDWIKLRNYTPPTAIAQIATEDTMTPYARKVFYVNAPARQSKSAFTQCSVKAEQTIVLGCYHGRQNGIFFLSVTDPRLEGVEQVTAAHEMLHAAYDRLSGSERAKIDKLLREYYNHNLKDERVRETVEAYRTSEPNDLTNEMHSIFGTEVADLPPALEQYYKKYFTNRGTVAAFAARYQAEFISRQQAIKNYDAQLTSLKARIDDLENDLNDRRGALDASSERLQQLRSSDDVSAYNAAVPGYNSQVNAFNDEVAQVKRLIDQYNSIVSMRNALAEETKQLTNEIDSTVAPINSK